MIAFILGLFNPLSRLLKTLDNKIDNETERERIKAETVQAYVAAQAQVLTGRGWWFPAVFILPLGLWWAAVIVYSILFCQSCAFPQSWSIAALPSPLDDWSGAIIASLFIGKSGEAIISKLRR